jgi:hypothetical protein
MSAFVCQCSEANARCPNRDRDLQAIFGRRTLRNILLAVEAAVYAYVPLSLESTLYAIAFSASAKRATLCRRVLESGKNDVSRRRAYDLLGVGYEIANRSRESYLPNVEVLPLSSRRLSQDTGETSTILCDWQ